MQIGIKDTELKIFSADAKCSMSRHVQSYAEYIKEEAERIAVAHYGKNDAKVTKEIIEGVIKLQGHYVGNKSSFFYSWLLPLLEAVFGGVLCNALFEKDKTFWTGVLIVSCILIVLAGMFLSYWHEKR